MEKEQRNILRVAVVKARRLLENEVQDQLEGAFNILGDGRVLENAPGDPFVRARILDLIQHHRAGGVTAGKAVERMVHETAFTVLNRFTALKMAERRGLAPACVSPLRSGVGIQQLGDCAPGLVAAQADKGYRLLLEAVMDEISLGLRVLFDRRSPSGLLWPRPQAIAELLEILNAPELEALWSEDEAVGWVYQYFNADDVKEMRDASPAPRNSRELAVRNQFFTPRYVVEFLVDNTLGRLWYEMRQGKTALRERCAMLACEPGEVFLAAGESPAHPAEASTPKEGGAPKPIPYRVLRDPRDLRVLDPAVGSGHFLLYAFDLLEAIYREAWQADDAPASEATGRTLRQDYPTEAELARAVPVLVLRHNLYGIEIDPRAAQIAALALWLRAQRAYQDLGLAPQDRPAIARSNIVVAEPMPGDEELLERFVARLEPAPLRDLVRRIWADMRLAGEAGSLLRIEEHISATVDEAARAAGPLFTQGQAGFWSRAEERLRDALERLAHEAGEISTDRRHLFAEDAAQGIAFIDVCRQRFDVIVMNPPFGAVQKPVEKYLRREYEGYWTDVYAAFLARALQLSRRPCIGAITSSQFLYTKQLRALRQFWISTRSLSALVELGGGVLDNAKVSTALTVTRDLGFERTLCIDLTNDDDKCAALRAALSSRDRNVFIVALRDFENLYGHPFCYHLDHEKLLLWSKHRTFEPSVGVVVNGNHTFDDTRFLRLRWEVHPGHLNHKWYGYEKGGEYQPFLSPTPLIYNWLSDGEEARAFQTARYGTDAQVVQSISYWFKRGITYPRISSIGFGPRAMPRGHIFSGESISVFVKEGIDPRAVLGVLCSSWIQDLLYAFGRYRKIENRAVCNLPLDDAVLACVARRMVPLTEQSLEQVSRIEASQETSALFSGGDLLGEAGPSASMMLLQHTAGTLKRLCDDIDSTVAAALFPGSYRPELTCEPRSALVDRFAHPVVTPKRGAASSMALSALVGVVFGRWDLRVLSRPELAISHFDAFDALPACPPAMLVGPDALPARADGIASEAWLRARLDANRPPSSSGVADLSITANQYPLEVPWDGILVDDPGLEVEGPAQADLVRRLREALALLYCERAVEIEAELCGVLGVGELRDYLRRPTAFFADHLSRYSRSRRKAPIYWPLSTESGSYTVWIYYPRLSADTLYRAVTEHLEPKLTRVSQCLAQVEGRQREADGREAARLAQEVSELVALRDEIRDLREEFLRVAHLPYRPNLDDGVQITAAPLWRVFRHKPWCKTLEDTWKALKKGDYDWAQLAYAIWPDRVREKCKTDRSLAIAHGLEEVFEATEPGTPRPPSKKRR